MTALNKGLPPRRKFHARDYAKILERQDYRCACGCGEKLTDARDIRWDHRLPLWMGGTDHPDNIDALKVKHHTQKTRDEAKALAKTRRIVGKGSHRKRNMSAFERELQKMLARIDQ